MRSASEVRAYRVRPADRVVSLDG
jgi:hypothetical protein